MSEIVDPTSPNFDPHSQPITIFYRDGTNLTLTLSDFNTANQAALAYCSIFAAQIGACLILLAIVGLLTSREKRRTLLFACNILALVTVIFRSFLAMEFYLGPFYDTYRFMSGDYYDIPSGARYTQIASTMGSLLLKSVVQFSLILQLRVVYGSSPKLNLAMTLGTSVIAMAAIALFFKVTVDSAKKIMEPAVGVYSGDWTYPAAKAMFAVSICIFCLIFVIKLGYAIRRRRILGLRAFGPLQIIFTVGCQTMVIPAAFSLADSIVEIDGLSSLTPTLVAIFLPLSSMWAAAQVEAPAP
ncbi:GPCR fungal pheromone mating factor, partial [Trichophaea hybrida]